ncbi:hypothetical protein ACE4Z8_10345 [Enterococcus avium]|uniref:hypothetical protein n=1 Tax=Enterococcus avium TaxID=33945 RepID=UPI002890E3D7|nr:hypothetical protein [Enterococcus avium]MDT2381047.1 hypothetical protein [Enterococcus avium]MDT2385585.1 hypothetical protein [Enterococcus avium]MDT2496830.1 hypothetical protein [Enterococcus avium]
METVFTLVFIIGCIGAWYFIKRSPNKRNRNISFGLIALSVIIIGFIPTTETKEVTSKPVEEKKTKQQSSAKISDLVLETPKEAISDDTGEVKISGKTSPNAEVSIGMGIVGDKTTADKSGDFMLLYELSSPETTLTINSKRDGDSKSTKIKVKMNDNALSALEEKEAEESRKAESKNLEKQKSEESKEAEQKRTEDSKNAENQKNSDITQLADEATPQQSDILTELALQQFDKSYPYKGSKLHIAIGKLQDWTQKDGKWFAKYEATIVNEFDAKRSANVEVTIEPVSESSGYVSFLDY